jgi:DNA polymerase III subunit delta'
MIAEPAAAATSAPALAWPAMLPWLVPTAREALARRASWPHALLLHGPRGIGKHALGLHFALALLCESPRADGLACGQCASCHYAVAGQHPDLMRLELVEIDDDGEASAVDVITIDRVRALIDFAQLTSHRRRAKVAVIAPAERMNPAAANALLKTIEEPPPQTYLILVSDQPRRVPATILSRCRKFPVPLPPTDLAREWLVGQGVAEPDLALAQANGAPIVARERADATIQAERRTWLAALAQPDRLPLLALAARVDAGGRDERKARLALAVDWMLAWTADLARVGAGGAPRTNPDFAEPLAVLAARVAPVALFRYHRSILRHRALLAHPLQPRAVAEALLIDYRGLFA